MRVQVLPPSSWLINAVQIASFAVFWHFLPGRTRKQTERSEKMKNKPEKNIVTWSSPTVFNMLLPEFLTKVKWILLCQLNLSIMYYVGIEKVVEMQWWASLSNLMSRRHCVFQGSGLQMAETQPAIRLHGSTAMLPRQPACCVVMLCRAPPGKSTWNNLLRSGAWVHWLKHVPVASELPGGLVWRAHPNTQPLPRACSFMGSSAAALPKQPQEHRFGTRAEMYVAADPAVYCWWYQRSAFKI